MDWARGLTWNNIGEAYIILDEPARAIEVVEPNYQLFMREHDLYCAAMCAFTLGRATGGWANLGQRTRYLDEAERLFRNLGNLEWRPASCIFAPRLALEEEDVAAARRDLAQALEDLSGQAREREYLWWLVERAGTLACQQGAPQKAAQLHAVAVRRRNAASPVLEPAEREVRARDLEWLRATLGETAFAEATATGEALSLDEAIAALRQALREQL